MLFVHVWTSFLVCPLNSMFVRVRYALASRSLASLRFQMCLEVPECGLRCAWSREKAVASGSSVLAPFRATEQVPGEEVAIDVPTSHLHRR